MPADSTAAQDRRRMYQALRRNGWGRWAAWREAVKYARLRAPDRSHPGGVRRFA